MNNFPGAIGRRRHRAALRLCAILESVLLLAVSTKGQTTNRLSPARIQGLQLAEELCNSAPAQDLTNTGVLQIRNRGDEFLRIPVTFEDTVTATNWVNIYKAVRAGRTDTLRVVHAANQPNVYYYETNSLKQMPLLNGVPVLSHLLRSPPKLSGAALNAPFAGSDFRICDLGLEFFHWPDQEIVKREFMRGRGCMVLESRNARPSPGGYSRVDSWIDEETLGIVHAQAYGADGKLLKIFDPKSFRKVNGQWQLQDMEIRNVQSGSRTRIEFDSPPA